MLLLECDHVARAHHSLFLAAALPYANTAHTGMPEATFVFRKFEVSLGLPRAKIGTETKVFVNRKGIDDFVGVHLVVRIPDSLELAECLYQFGSEHFWKHFRLRLAVAVLSRNGTAVFHDEIDSLADKRAIVANSFNGAKIEIDASMNAALAEVPVERAVIAVLFEEFAQIAQIVADFVGRNSGVLPTFPCDWLSGNEGRGAKSRFANLPNELFLLFVVVKLHSRSAGASFETGHHRHCFRVRFFLAFAPEFDQQEALAIRQQCQVFLVKTLFLHIADQAIVDSF